MENKDNIKADEPILIIQRNKSRKIFFILLDIIHILIAFALIMIDKGEPYTTIIGFFILIVLIFTSIASIFFQSAICYDDKIKFNYLFWNRNIKYEKIKRFETIFTPYFQEEVLMIRTKLSTNIVDLIHLFLVYIPMVYTEKNDFEKLREIVKEKLDKKY